MNFDPVKCEEYVRMLIDHDEVERALLVLNNTPAHIRDRMPKNLFDLKTKILSSMCTPNAYHLDGLDQPVSVQKAIEFIDCTTRGVIIQNEVKRYNARGFSPHIIDIGPGEYGVPIGLKSKGLGFTYFAMGLDHTAFLGAQEHLVGVWEQSAPPAQPVICVMNEIIEHLPEPRDLVTDCLRAAGRWPDRVHISTPHYCYDLNDKKWEKKSGLPHLRAYTSSEFITEVNRLFPGYVLQCYDGPIQSIRACHQGDVDAKSLYEEK